MSRGTAGRSRAARLPSRRARGPRVLVAHQPPYLPHAAFVAKVASADVWVVQDDLQYAKGEWQNRNRIRTATGWRWLTIAVHARGLPSIAEVTVADRGWARRHRRIVEHWYRRSPFHERLATLWESAFEMRSAPLARVALATTRELFRALGVTTPIVLESEVGLEPGEQRTPTDRLVALCRRLSCGAYLSGVGGRDYIDEAAFARAGIELRWQRFHLPPYRQLHPGFVPGLSVIDLTLCHPDPCAHVLADVVNARRTG